MFWVLAQRPFTTYNTIKNEFVSYKVLVYNNSFKEIKMKIVIADININFINAVKNAILETGLNETQVEVFHGSFTHVPDIDCMVAAGNSFGVMGGGVDKAIRDHFGFEIQNQVQSSINRAFLGELPVGSSILIETGKESIPYLIYAPTMRTPKSIKGTDIPYVATWSSITTAERFIHNTEFMPDHLVIDIAPLDTLVIPGMGTGAGGIPLEVAAKQMVLAIKNYFLYKDSYSQGKTDMHTRGYSTEKSLYLLK